MKKYGVAAVMVAALLAATDGSAADKTKTKKADFGPSLMIPFDVGIDRIKEGINTHGPLQVAKAAMDRSRDAEKSQYETSDDYAKRAADLENKPLFGSVKAGDMIAVAAEELLDMAFDADDQTITGSIPASVRNGSAEVAVSSNSKKLGKFVGSNAFGVKRVITKYQDAAIRITFSVNDMDGASFSLPPISIAEAIANANCSKYKSCADAKKDEAHNATVFSKALLVGRLVYPYGSYEKTYKTATIDDPEEREIHTFKLHMCPEQIWVYNMINDRVYKKIDFKEVWGGCIK